MTERLREPGRRRFLAAMSAVGGAALVPAGVFGQNAGGPSAMPSRAIPASGEALPVIGLGSSKVVQEIATEGSEPLAQVLRTLVDAGGRVVDTWPRDADNDAAFGRVLERTGLSDRLFVTTKVDRQGREAGIEQFRQAQLHYRRDVLDLAQVFNLTDVDTHWRTLRELKDEGSARYIGVTVSDYRLYEPLQAFLRRETPDFVQVNYSVSERRAEERVLPMLQDMGVAVMTNRPFMNGAYFGRVDGEPLPGWAADIGCESWAQLSLKYILAHPAVTCVLTETTNPRHMAENARAASGPRPDAGMLRRMRDAVDRL